MPAWKPPLLASGEPSNEDDKPTVDELGEQVADIVKQGREQTGVLMRIADRVDSLADRFDEIHRIMLKSGPPFLPRDEQEHPR